MQSRTDADVMESPPGEAAGSSHDTRIQPAASAQPDRFCRELLDALPTAVYTTDAAGRLTYYNRAAVALSGREPELGSDTWCVSWRLYKPDGHRLPHDQCPMAMALKSGEAVRGTEAVAERPDGSRVPFVPYPTPLHDRAGNVIGAVNTLVDISEQKEAEARQRALLDEVNHRVKNTLATVQALAMQTLRGAGVPDSAREAFQGRLFALSGVHNQLAREHWVAADLQLTLQELVAPYGGEDRVRLNGSTVRLPPKLALALAMVVHELVANASRHGALSTPRGVVEVWWSVENRESQRTLRLDWRECGGPAVQGRYRQGFGTRLLDQVIREELRGTARLDFEPGGVRCRMTIPLGGERA